MLLLAVMSRAVHLGELLYGLPGKGSVENLNPAHFVLVSGLTAWQPSLGTTRGITRIHTPCALQVGEFCDGPPVEKPKRNPVIHTPCELQVGEFFDGLPAVGWRHGMPSYLYQPNSFQRARYPDDYPETWVVSPAPSA